MLNKKFFNDKYIHRIPLVTGMLVIIIGLLVLISRWLDLELLKEM